VLVDGLRSTVELERFREAFGDDFTLVAVRAPFEIRAERLDDRGRASPTPIWRPSERDAREIELGLGETLERADVEIDNTGTLAAFRGRPGGARRRGRRGERRRGSRRRSRDPERRR